MNRVKSYDVTNLSFSDIDNLEKNYIFQVKNKDIKKLEIKINENNLSINVEPYYLKTDKWNELNNVLKNKKVNFWFRDDDVGLANEKLKEMLYYFNKRNINVLLAAIPSKVNIFTKEALSKFNNYLVGQHGYSHINHSNIELAEFTINRDTSVVKNEIELGNNILEELFGEKYIKVFIPPWFEIDDNTHKIINELKYTALSNYWSNNKNKFGMNEINCQVDLINWENTWTFGGEEFVLNQLIKEISNCNDEYVNIGILLHHERMGKIAYQFLDYFLDFIEEKANIVDFDILLNNIEVKND